VVFVLVRPALTIGLRRRVRPHFARILLALAQDRPHQFV
jgi:hypothetical protein